MASRDYAVGRVAPMKEEPRLAEKIFQVLRQTEGASISKVVEELRELGVETHRLTITGYLNALADAGYLEVKRIPPVRMFTLKRAVVRNVYSAIGEASRSMTTTEAAALELAAATAMRLLDRPLFLSEVADMGFTRTGVLRQLGKKEAAEACKRLEEGGVRVREGEPMFDAKGSSDADVSRVLDEVLLSAFSARSERVRAVKQTSLTLEKF